MTTNYDTLKLLCRSIITRLENDKAIVFPASARQLVVEEVFQLVKPMVYTGQDLKDQTLAKIGLSAGEVDEAQFSENDQFRAAKAVVRRSFGDDELNGFYFQKPLKTMAESIADYLMRSRHVEEVFESDDVIEQTIITTVKRFNPADLH